MNWLDINRKTIINKSQYGDLGITTNGEGEFKCTTIVGVGRNTYSRAQECLCVHIQRLKGIPPELA
jgi:hypothetical protein